MPADLTKELWMLISTVAYFFVGLILFGISIWLMEKLTPFSMRKEIEEDQNTAVGVVIAGILIALAIVLSAAIR